MNTLNRLQHSLKALSFLVLSALILFFLPAAFSATLPGVSAGGSGNPISILDPQSVFVTYTGPQPAVAVLNSNQAKPLSLTRGDFNQDGIEDLIAGYAAPDGSGVLALYAGNLDALAPQSHESWLAIGQGQFPSPFLPTAKVLQLPCAPAFLATGNFAGSDHPDIVAAARNGSMLCMLAGDGHGSFGTPTTIAVPGPVSAMAAGRFGLGNLRSTVMVGIGGPKPALLVYSRIGPELSLTGAYALAAPASAIAFDDLDGDGLPDAVIAAGGQVSILHAIGASGRPELEKLDLPVSAVALTTGFFVHDRAWRRQIAVLEEGGAVSIVAHGGFDARGWSKAEIKAMRDALVHRQRNPFARTEPGPVRDGWKVIETLSGMAAYADPAQPPMMLRSRIFAQGTDDLLVIDRAASRLAGASHTKVSSEATSFTPASLSTRTGAMAGTVAAVSFQVNVDAREGLVLLNQDRAAPLVMMPVPGPHAVSVPQQQEAK